MTATTIWQDIGAGENRFTKLLRFLFLLVAAVIFCYLAIVPLSWPQQAVLGLVSLAAPCFLRAVPIPISSRSPS